MKSLIFSFTCYTAAMVRASHWRMLCLIMGAAITVAPRQQLFADDLDASTESSIRILRQALTPQRDGSDLRLLFALRQLHDPDFKPFLQQLLETGNWQVQVHAMLGLAEIDPSKHIDPLLLRKIAPEAQESVLATGLDLKLLPNDLIKDILKWEGLQPMARLFLMAELVSLKEPVNNDDLVKLTKSEDNHIAGLSACLLAQLGDAEPLTAFRSRLANVAADLRNDVILWLLEAVRRYHLVACGEWVKAVVVEPQADPEIAYRGVFTMLDIDPTTGLQLWDHQLGEKPTFQKRVRFGLILLATTIKTPSAYARLRTGDDEELINRMCAMGKVFAEGRDPTEALIGLLDLNHIKTTDWVMSYLPKIPPEQSRRVYAHLVDRVSTDKPNSDDVVSLAIQGASKLFETDPAAALDRLKRAEDDSLLQQAILLGLFETTSPKPSEAAATLRRIGSGKADSLALLLMAKHTPKLSDADKYQLGKVASGGGRLSDILQVQAAWLYLKQTGQTDKVVMQK